MNQVELIHRPMFYISAFLEANRDRYYDKLPAVFRDDWTGWYDQECWHKSAYFCKNVLKQQKFSCILAFDYKFIS